MGPEAQLDEGQEQDEKATSLRPGDTVLRLVLNHSSGKSQFLSLSPRVAIIKQPVTVEYSLGEWPGQPDTPALRCMQHTGRI